MSSPIIPSVGIVALLIVGLGSFIVSLLSYNNPETKTSNSQKGSGETSTASPRQTKRPQYAEDIKTLLVKRNKVEANPRWQKPHETNTASPRQTERSKHTEEIKALLQEQNKKQANPRWQEFNKTSTASPRPKYAEDIKTLLVKRNKVEANLRCQNFKVTSQRIATYA